jgi:CheY-like chemotaxis protein
VPRQARILLVDDRVENLIALDAILSPLNQILVPVQSGAQAAAAETAARLSGRVGRLRDALDALGVD